MTHPITLTLEPPLYLSLAGFKEAHRKIQGRDFYILSCHENARNTATYIQANYKAQGIEVDISYREDGDRFSWLVHALNNQGPPFLTETVESHMKV